MKTEDVPKYVIGGVAVLVPVVFFVWLIRSEGERTRRIIRDSRQESETSPPAGPHNGKDAAGRPADLPRSAPDARQPTAAERQPGEKEPTVAKAAEANPPVVEPKAGAEDFNLDDHDVFPGLRPAARTTSNK
jgi:hypothetical protein